MNFRAGISVKNAMLVLLGILISTAAVAQNSVKGTVVDEQNEPLIGVAVILEGTVKGTITNIEGEYQLELENPDEAILNFTYMGYRSKEIKVNGRSEINVEMELNIEELEEVVVIGYGTQKKSDLTGALSSVSSKDIQDLPALGVEQALQGKAAGVEVINNSGAPGSSVTVRIRGMGTLNAGSQPLYVVDGFIMGDQTFGKEGGNVPDNKMGINFLNPNDIESIEILKDASAAAIYGARGANGVVLITTKKGKSGEAKVDMEVYRGVQTLYKKYDLMNADEFRGYVDDFVEARGAYPGYEPELEIEARTDWIDQVIENAKLESYNIAVSGGNDNATYSISTNYFNQEGLIPAADFSRLSVRLNSTQKLNERIKTGQSVIVARSIRNRVANEGQILSNAMIADPSAAVYDEDGNWNELLLTSQAGNPVGVLERNNYLYESYRYFGNAFMDIKIFDGFTSNTRAGIDINEGNLEAFQPQYEISPSDRRDQNIFTVRDERWINWDFETTLRYNQSFGKHDLNVVAGFTAQKESFIDTRLTFQGFPFDEEFMRYPNLPNPDGIVAEVGSSPMEYSILSLLSRVQYTYSDKWLLTASIRRDGSSKFGPNNRYGSFPSFSVGYRISEEEFMKNIPFIASSKFRIGWGQLGNQSIPPYAFSTSVSNAANYTVGNNEIVTGSLPDGVVNEAIQWETATQTNLGLDVALFDYQLQFNIDAFYKLTSDMLLPIPIPSFTGIHNVQRVGGEPPFAFGNAGEMETRGLEFALTYQYAKNDFSLSASGNISFVRNEILSLAGNSAIPSNIVNSVPASRTQEGRSVAGFYGYQIEGIFQSYDEIAAHAEQGPLDPHMEDPAIDPNPRLYIAPGDFKFKDLNGDGIINDDDRTFIGDPLPDFTYGTSINAKYKNFDFSMSMVGVQGNDIINGMTFFLRGYSLTNKSREVLNAWTPENRNTDQPRLGVNRNNNMRFSDFWVFDGSYLRLQNITLGYNLPSRFFDNVFLDKIRLYATVQNLFTITNYPGMEPEIGSSVGFNPDPLDFGLDNATFPQPRTFIGGINISF